MVNKDDYHTINV